MDIKAEFNKAIRDITILSKKGENHNYERFSLDVHREKVVLQGFISEAKKFYVPADMEIITDKSQVVNGEIPLRIPFPCVAILSESFNGAGLSEVPSIIFAKEAEDKIELSAMMYEKDRRRWLPAFVAGSISRVDGDIAFAYKRRYKIEENVYRTKEMLHDFVGEMTRTVVNLIELLSIQNISHDRIETKKGAGQFIKRKKALDKIDSYHVITIDGKRCLSNESGSTVVGGKRSHSRRGHIRHLSSGKNVWVRACLIKGSRKGSVESDYKFRGAST